MLNAWAMGIREWAAMRLFLISAELHGVSSPEDRDRFDASLAAHDIVRHVRGNDGLDHDLPTGTYAYAGDIKAEEVVALTFEAANMLDFPATIIAAPIGDDGWASSNLRRTRP